MSKTNPKPYGRTFLRDEAKIYGHRDERRKAKLACILEEEMCEHELPHPCFFCEIEDIIKLQKEEELNDS